MVQNNISSEYDGYFFNMKTKPGVSV